MSITQDKTLLVATHCNKYFKHLRNKVIWEIKTAKKSYPTKFTTSNKEASGTGTSRTVSHVALASTAALIMTGAHLSTLEASASVN